MIFAKIYVISNFSKQNPFLLVSVAKIAHLFTNVNPVLQKNQIYRRTGFSSFTRIYDRFFPNLARIFFQIRFFS